jgi:lipopolysaccharide/colanic/teichoic acid biosynthesis glycosyltransferase
MPKPETISTPLTKRLFDLCVGTLVLLVTLPFWLLIALSIWVDSGRPIFFGRYPSGELVLRVGQGGRLFHFVKFRTMVLNDHKCRYQMPSHRTGPLVKIKNDPRITRVGAWLRQTSLDELPNLLAVLKGDMSLVGPRPHLPEEVAKYDAKARGVLAVLPGLTGLPQVSGRSDLDFAREVELDLQYIREWSLWLDIKILCKTALVVLFPAHKE